jgi:exopolysaccharide production protein ExoY
VFCGDCGALFMGSLLTRLASLRGHSSPRPTVGVTAPNSFGARLIPISAGSVFYQANAIGPAGENAENRSAPFPQKQVAGPVPRPLGGTLKRACDIGVSAVAIILLSPLILFTYLLVRVFLGAPAVFAHRRVGFNGVGFNCYKFRTMIPNAEESLRLYLAGNPRAAEEWFAAHKLTDDPRVCSIGKILRRSSLDELPQLFNVLRGDMSLVGPRPIVSGEINRYGWHAQEYFKARPGLSGLWQVNGRNSRTYDERVAFDRYYVRRWRFGLDFEILLRTVPAVLKTRDTA